MHTRLRGFSLIEILVVIAIIGLLISMLLPALAGARQAARRAVCMSNMSQLGRAHHSYAQDFRGFVASFNGRTEDIVARNNPGMPTAIGSDISRQVTWLKKFYSGEVTSQERVSNEFDPADPRIFPFEQFSHFMLAAYVGETLTSPVTVCPEDRPRLAWRSTPHDITASPFQPTKPSSKSILSWFPYSSSYQLMPAAIMDDGPTSPVRILNPSYIYHQGSTHDTYNDRIEAPVIGRRRQSDVVFPAGKVAVADSQQRHFGRRDMYYAYPDAKQPLLFWDSSVSVRQTGNGKKDGANKGWDPTGKCGAGPYITSKVTSFIYEPDPGFESPYLLSKTGSPIIGMTGFYKWTRGGFRGIDFGGSEISTANW